MAEREVEKMTEKIIGKMTNIEFEMAIDELESKLPYQLRNISIQAKVFKAKFDSLKGEGFTDAQALEIVKTRPLYE